ncbi:MAG: ATP-binding protein [Pseudomonadota bacterium]|nr:ATP-binding protein [Pseudomonadota bacterium]
MTIRTGSIVRLILYGFAFVFLPLIVAVGYAVSYVGTLSDQSRFAVYQSMQASQNSRLLAEQVTAMERNVRQYLVLSDAELFAAYEASRSEFQKSIDALQALALDQSLRGQVTELGTYENETYLRLRSERRPVRDVEVTAMFSRLMDMSRAVFVGSSKMIDREVEILQATATRARQTFLWIAAGLVSLAVFSAIVFPVLISRPIRQVERAIRDLGDGNFDHPIRVTGPRDVEGLGERLDWLRLRLIELEGQKTRFLRHMSHELKTPLTAIREGGQLLKDAVAGPLNREQREIVDILTRSSVNLQGLIENLLNFSMAQSQTPRLNLKDIDLKSLVSEVVQNHKPAILSKTLRVEVILEPVKAHADEDKLRTVIDNLIANAIKFSRTAGQVGIRLTEEHGRAVLDVVDQGPGIDPADREKVFDAFYQGPQLAQAYVKGSGLGLSISREYMRVHNGNLEVVVHEGPGAWMRAVLPLPDEDTK